MITYIIFASLLNVAKLSYSTVTRENLDNVPRYSELIHPVGFTDRKIYSNVFRPIFSRVRGTALRFLLFKVWMDPDDEEEEEEEGKSLIRSAS